MPVSGFFYVAKGNSFVYNRSIDNLLTFILVAHAFSLKSSPLSNSPQEATVEVQQHIGNLACREYLRCIFRKHGF